MILQPHPTPSPNEEPVHTTVQAYTDTLCATQREANPHYILTSGYPNVQSSSLLKVRGLAHGPRDCCRHLEPHMSS